MGESAALTDARPVPAVHVERGYPSSVSVVVPAYNETETIGRVLQDLKEFIETVPEVRWEIIVIDDASADDTRAVASQVPDITVLYHPANMGYGASLKTGIRAATGDYVLTMDADGQHIASEIAHLLPDAVEYDITIGRRDARSSPMTRRPGKALLGFLVRRLVDKNISDFNSGQRLIRRATIRRYLNVCANRFSFSMSSTIAIVSEGHFVRFIDIACRNRRSSESQVRTSTGLRAMLLIVRLAIVFHPLRIFLPLAALSLMGLSFSLVNDFMTSNVSDLTLFLLFISVMTIIVGFLSDQIAHIRRELYRD